MRLTNKAWKYIGVFIALCLINLLLLFDTNAQDKSLLWKISGKGLSEPSYLYGTIHLICPEALNIDQATKNAVASTEQLVLEIDMDDPNFMTKMGQLSLNPGMENISSKLSEEDLKTVNAFFQKNYQADLNQLGVMKPMALLSLVLPKALTCAQPASIEKNLMELNKDKEVIGLETPEFQMGVFDKIPIQDQLDWLVEYTSDQTVMKEEFEDMLNAYKAHDIERLYDVMVSNPQFADYGDLLLYNRNADWIEKITEIIKDKPSFIAVGAGHLGSEKGVLALLRKKGYTVSAVY